ncbi:MAG: GNAT family protein [Bacteroidia bacterium]
MVHLEAFAEKHLGKTYQWMLDHELRENFLFRKTLSKEDHKRWFENYLKDQSQRISAVYYENAHVGNLGLKHIDRVNNNAETWIYVGEAGMKGKGIGTEAYQQLVAACRPELHKLYAHIADFNQSSVKMYQKAGFIKEGDFKDQIYWGGRYYNLLRFAFYL